jgi:hypothetical protein
VLSTSQMSVHFQDSTRTVHYNFEWETDIDMFAALDKKCFISETACFLSQRNFKNSNPLRHERTRNTHHWLQALNEVTMSKLFRYRIQWWWILRRAIQALRRGSSYPSTPRLVSTRTNHNSDDIKQYRNLHKSPCYKYEPIKCDDIIFTIRPI